MAKGKYDDALAELTAKAAGIPEMVQAIKKSMTSGKLSLDTDITKLLKQKTRPGRDEQIEMFKQEFRKAYGLSDDNYAKMSSIISDSYKKNPDFMFDSQGGLKAESVESLVLLVLDLKEKKDVKFEPFVERIPEKYNGVKTLGDLIAKYGSNNSADAQLKAESAEKDRKIQELEARLNSAGKNADASAKAAREYEMHKLLESMDAAGGFPLDVKVRFYETYLGMDPQNELLAGIVNYSLAYVLMTNFKEDEKALPYFKKALELVKKEYAQNPGSPDVLKRRVNYDVGLQACEENINKKKPNK